MWSFLIKVYTFIELFERESSPVADFIGFLLCNFLYCAAFYWLALAYYNYSPSKCLHQVPDSPLYLTPSLEIAVLVRRLGFAQNLDSDDD